MAKSHFIFFDFQEKFHFKSQLQRQRVQWLCRRCPFRKRSMPFSRHLETFSAIGKFFSTELKKKESM